MTTKPISRGCAALIGVAMLAACGGGGSGYGSSPEPVVAPPPAPFVISGTVPTFLDQGTEVSLNVSGETFTTTTDAQGRYELTLEGDIADTGFAVVTAQGQGSQEFIEFKSVLGQVSALKALAGSDNRLTVHALKFNKFLTTLTLRSYDSEPSIGDTSFQGELISALGVGYCGEYFP